jgi:hypothetical protein
MGSFGAEDLQLSRLAEVTFFARAAGGAQC